MFNDKSIFMMSHRIFIFQSKSPLDCKKIKPVNPKGNQSWIFIGRTDADTETPILWPPDAKSWLIGRDPDAGKDWRQEETGTTEDEMIGWHHQLDGHEFEQAPGVGDGQGSVECCSPWGCKELDLTEPNWKILYALLIHPSMLICNIWQPLIFLLSPNFAFSEVYVTEIIQHAGFSDRLLSLSTVHLSFFHVFSWFDISFLFSIWIKFL